ncbi:hypothetical protein [Desulfolithobacter sp.]
MNIFRCLFVGVLVLALGGCGQTVQQSLKQPLVKKSLAGAEKRVVILPFADYSRSDNLETSYRRNLLITENLTDELVSNSFSLPIQEDVFRYLAEHKIINVIDYGASRTSLLEEELKGDWSEAMKNEFRRYIMIARERGQQSEALTSPGTHGLTQQEIVKIGRHFGADYIIRGRILEYKDRQDPSWKPWKKGVLTFVTGVTNKIAFGQASSDTYDRVGSMSAGVLYGSLAGNNLNTPWDTDKPDQTIFGITGGSDANSIFWGTIGAGAGALTHNSGRVPQAVVQLRIWVQDAYTGDVVWTNRVDVKVSPESVLADYQYDALFEQATERAIATLIDNFVATGI